MRTDFMRVFNNYILYQYSLFFGNKVYERQLDSIQEQDIEKELMKYNLTIDELEHLIELNVVTRIIK